MKRHELLQSVAWNLFLITLGSVIFAFGAKAILLHHNFIIGGIYGTALLIYYSTDILSPGLLYLIGNLPLLVLGIFMVSKRFLLYSLYAVAVITLASELIHYNLHIVDQFYAAVAGGVICGTGSGIVLRSLGSGGGLDIVAIILNQKFNIGIGKFSIMFNGCLFAVALTLYEIDLVVASFILTFISAITLDYVLALFNQRKIVYILSDFSKDIANKVWRDMKQGATMIGVRGAYSGKDKNMLMMITNNLQVKRLEEKVFTIDPNALFIVENSFNVIGSTFGKRKIY